MTDRFSQIYKSGIGFYSLSGSFSYLSLCLAEGLSALGIPVHANSCYSEPEASDYGFRAADLSAIQEASIVVVDLDQLDVQIAKGTLQHSLPFARYVLLSMNDNVASFTPPPEIPFFCTHENRYYELPGLRIPWGFGCSSRVIEAVRPTGAPRTPRIVANFRPTHAQSVRQALDLALVSPLKKSMQIDAALSDPGRWGAAHFEKLRGSIACLAYGGYFAQDLHKTPFLAGSLPPSPATFHRDTVVLRWDSWRFWESLAAGCATVHLDLNKYGCLLPEMPENGVHYIGIDLEDIPAAVAMLTGPRERLEAIGEQGRLWALQHYSPIAVARRFIKCVSAPEQHRTAALAVTLGATETRCEPCRATIKPRIVVDGVFFQYRSTGIARVWTELLRQWAATPLGKEFLILDRNGTAPIIAGLNYRTIPPHDYRALDADRQMLQQICDEQNAACFISTYYSTPLSTPSGLMVHDCIPEALGADLLEPAWQEKQHAIAYAQALCCVSAHTAADLLRYYPDTAGRTLEVIHHGVSDVFHPAADREISELRSRYSITRPYFLFVGPVEWYKNFTLLIEAFAELPNRSALQVVRTRREDGDALHPLCADPQTVITTDRLVDEELRAAYSGALALVYPSWYEGFGLPILEAMACGCPVIAADATAVPEVAGHAALLVPPHDRAAMVKALQAVQQPHERQRLSAAGRDRAASFNWAASAARLGRLLMSTGKTP